MRINIDGTQSFEPSIHLLTASELGALCMLISCSLGETTSELLQRPDVIEGLKSLIRKGYAAVEEKGTLTINFGNFAEVEEEPALTSDR